MKNFIIILLANLISEKILVNKLKAKMLLFNEITRLFDHQYLWKESVDFVHFWSVGSHFRNSEDETIKLCLV